MNKTLTAIAVGAALALPLAARADVVVTGRAQVEVQNKKTELGGVWTTQRNLVDNQMGRIGFDAAEDLSDGLTGLAHYGILIPTGEAHPNGSLTMRQSYVGIAGGFGTVRFGRLAGAYKDTNLDPYIDTALDARNFGGESAGPFGHTGFLNNVIKYNGTFGHLKFSALASALNRSASPQTPTATAADPVSSGDYQAALDYQGTSLRVILAYSRNKDATGPNTPAETLSKLALQYYLGSSILTAQVEKAKHYTGANDPALGLVGDVGNADFYLLSYNFRFGDMNSLYLRYGREKYKDAPAFPAGLKLSSYAAALQHGLSKTFHLWIGYFQAKTDPIAEKTAIFSVGMRKDF